jgi:hypothetical protein
MQGDLREQDGSATSDGVMKEGTKHTESERAMLIRLKSVFVRYLF